VIFKAAFIYVLLNIPRAKGMVLEDLFCHEDTKTRRGHATQGLVFVPSWLKNIIRVTPFTVNFSHAFLYIDEALKSNHEC